MESTGGFRHLAFFEELGKMDESDPNWRSVSAGLVVMRLVDEWIAVGADAVRTDSWGVSAVRDAIAGRSGDDSASSNSSRDRRLHRLRRRPSTFTRSFRGSWPTPSRWTTTRDGRLRLISMRPSWRTRTRSADADLVVSAFIQLAYCRRMLSDFDRAAAAYGTASRVAHAAGDLIGVLRGRLGDAKIAIATRQHAEGRSDSRGDHSSALTLSGLDDIRSRALHERAYRRRSQRASTRRAVQLAYEALACSPAATRSRPYPQRHRDGSAIPRPARCRARRVISCSR